MALFLLLYALDGTETANQQLRKPLISQALFNLPISPKSLHPLPKPTHLNSPMAETSGSGKNGGGDDGDRPRVSGTETMSPRIDDQTTDEAPTDTGAGISGHGGGDGGHAAEGGGYGERRTPVEVGRTPVGAESGVPQVQPLDPVSGVAGSVVTGGCLGGVGGSSSSGGGGEGQTGLPPRGPESFKDSMVEEDVLREAHTERVEFIQPVGSCSHEPIMSSDL